MKYQKIRSKSRGFNLVELMIGLTIALIFLLVVAGIFGNANQQKNTTSSGADAQTSGAIASHMIEREVRMAGFGLNSTDLLGCEIYSYDEKNSPARYFTYSAVPAVITSGDTIRTSSFPYGTPDSLTLNYGNSDVGYSLAKLTTSNNGNNANYKVANRFGFHEGDVIVVVEAVDRYTPDANGTATVGTNGFYDCALAQVTGVPGGGNSDNIIHNSGNYTDANGNTVAARYNKPSGLGISFTTNAEIYDLGPSPSSVTFSINARGELTRLDLMDNQTSQAVADNIIMLRARYGKDTDGDGTVDTWDQTKPTTAVQWKQLLAIQFAVVARSQKKEGTMVTATPLTLWPGGPTLDLTDDQRKYRYKVFSSMVPMRNMIWSAS